MSKRIRTHQTSAASRAVLADIRRRNLSSRDRAGLRYEAAAAAEKLREEGRAGVTEIHQQMGRGC
jgi:hypothetical protein